MPKPFNNQSWMNDQRIKEMLQKSFSELPAMYPQIFGEPMKINPESGIDPEELRRIINSSRAEKVGVINPMDADYFEMKLREGKDKDLSLPGNHDDKHDVSDKVLDTLKAMSYQQDDYGIAKYKKALHHSYNYDWMAMFLEEIVDGLKYIQNEMDRRAVIKGYLETAIKIKDWTHVQKALDLLNIKGTGK